VEKLGGDADIDDDDEDADDDEDSGADRVGSFLCGQAGVMALSAVVAHYRHQPDLRCLPPSPLPLALRPMIGIPICWRGPGMRWWSVCSSGTASAWPILSASSSTADPV
jgi:hypothetical protein